MNLTNTPSDVQKEIVKRMEIDLAGGEKTGFYSYVEEGQIFFDYRWLLLIGAKKWFESTWSFEFGGEMDSLMWKTCIFEMNSI